MYPSTLLRVLGLYFYNDRGNYIMSYYECIGHSQAELDAKYNAGYSAGVTAADNRANSSSTNYKTGYNAGVTATKVGTAIASCVRNGYTFTNSSSVGISGTMSNYTGSTVRKTFSPSTSSQSYTIPAGYHDGNGTVTCSAISTSSYVSAYGPLTLTNQSSCANGAYTPTSVLTLKYGNTTLGTITSSGSYQTSGSLVSKSGTVTIDGTSYTWYIATKANYYASTTIYVGISSSSYSSVPGTSWSIGMSSAITNTYTVYIGSNAVYLKY